MICKFCGAEIKDDAAFCTACGKSLTETETETVVGEVVSDVKHSKAPKILGIVSLVCAILSVLAGVIPCVGSFLAFVLWIAALVTGIVSNSIAKKKGQKKSGLAKAGIIISIVVAVLAVLATILGAVGYVLYIFVLAGASA
jgi:hypothetical protein